MASPISAVISIAAGGTNLAANPQAVAAARSSLPENNRIVQAVNEQAERRRKKVQDSKEKRRGVEGEKKTEAAFTPRELKAKTKAAPNEEDKDDNQNSGGNPFRIDKVDVIA